MTVKWSLHRPFGINSSFFFHKAWFWPFSCLSVIHSFFEYAANTNRINDNIELGEYSLLILVKQFLTTGLHKYCNTSIYLKQERDKILNKGEFILSKMYHHYNRIFSLALLFGTRLQIDTFLPNIWHMLEYIFLRFLSPAGFSTHYFKNSIDSRNKWRRAVKTDFSWMNLIRMLDPFIGAKA